MPDYEFRVVITAHDTDEGKKSELTIDGKYYSGNMRPDTKKLIQKILRVASGNVR